MHKHQFLVRFRVFLWRRRTAVFVGTGLAFVLLALNILPTTPLPADLTKRSGDRSISHQAAEEFPPFIRAVHPVANVPNWGAMRTPKEWNRTYGQISAAEFVPVPPYDLAVLTFPLSKLVEPRRVPEITSKLYYSTRHMGTYNLNAGEYTGRHPGMDLKLAKGTPVGSIAGGRVHAVRRNRILGLHVMIEHRIRGERLFSIYGHLDATRVTAGDDVRPGQIIGTVGTSGNVIAHLHLQIDRAVEGEKEHVPYLPAGKPSRAEADARTVHPLRFIQSIAAEGSVATR